MQAEKRDDVYVAPTSVTTAIVNRISWGAIFAGLLVAMVMQLALSILGIGIGASAVDFQERTDGRALGIGAIVWFGLTALISLYVGGYVAGRLAGVPRRQDACLHGILTWGAQTLVTFLLLTTAVGTFIGGMAGVLGRSLSLSGQDIREVFPQAAGASGIVSEQTTGSAYSKAGWDAVRQDSKSLATQGQPAHAQELERALKQMFDRSAGQPANATDREALVTAVAQYTGKSQAEAEQQVARWEQIDREAQQKVQGTQAQAGENLREAASTATRGISVAALWTFGMLLLGAVAAAWGGANGRPRAILTQTPTTLNTEGTL